MSERIDYTKVSPRGVKALGGVHLYVAQSGLPEAVLAAVYLRVSLINGCAYCIDTHSRELRELGVSNEKVALVSVWDEAGELFDARERAALAWAETVTLISTTDCRDSTSYVLARRFSAPARAASLPGSPPRQSHTARRRQSPKRSGVGHGFKPTTRWGPHESASKEKESRST